MNNYVKRAPEKPSFEREGFNGHIIDIENENISITYENVYKGHDKYCTNTKIAHIYYVLSGNGKFRIDGEIYEVRQRDIVEIPAGKKFIFAGKMELLLIMNPKFDKSTEIVGEDNDLY